MLPPFAAVGAGKGGFVLATDTMGFRQVFRREGPGWLALSTSARALARLTDDRRLDRDGLLLQSLLGWQLDQGTIFSEVVKLSPGERFGSSGQSYTFDVMAPATSHPLSLDEAAATATTLLRSFLERFLDEHPEPALHLSGGQDTRLVLSAIPVARRRGLTAITMGEPGTPDVDISAALASRYGMRHVVQGLDGLRHVSPEECFARACQAARRLDCMLDPIAAAVAMWAEERFPQGARLSGVGGEVARAFYYTGVVRDTPVTRRRAERLARWRMFANEAVETAALDPHFVADARISANNAVYRALTRDGLDWYRATDELYLRHRLQRWAGLGTSAVCFDRQIVGPFLDDQFRAIANALPPQAKAHALFISRLQVSLDPELADLPLDNRPAPAVLATPGITRLVRQTTATTTRLARKAKQRLIGARRPAVGGRVFAGKITQHLRESPTTVDDARGRGIFDDRWLDQLVAGDVQPEPSTLAFLVNVVVATE